MAPEITRRRALSMFAGGIAISGTGYVGAHAVAKAGEVVARYVIAEEKNPDRTVEIVEVERNRNDTIDVRKHSDVEDRLVDESPVTVPTAVHEDLSRRFDRVRYHLAQSCPNAKCSVPQVSRGAFNNAPIRSDIKLLYHGENATRIA